jgi:hypothetical protein
MAVASVVTATVGFILWPIVGGWITLIAASAALGLGFVALSRIGRTRERGRWAAITVNGLARPRFYATPGVKLTAAQRQRTVATTTCPAARRAQIATE